MKLDLPRGCPVTLAVVVLNVVLFLAQGATGDTLTRLGVLYGPAVQAGDWWRLASSGFLHGSLVHVGFNTFLLYALGQQLEQGIGSLRFALIYLAALFGGSLAVMLFDFAQPTLGASGAVMGMAAAFAVALHAQGNDPRQHPVFGLVVLNLGLPLLIPMISFWGHLGGVVGGVLMATVIIWRPIRSSRLAHHPAAHTATLSSGLATLVLLIAASVLAARLGGVG